MLTRKAVDTYGIVAIFIVLVLLLLVMFRQVPETMYLPLFLIALALFLVRVTMRLLYHRQERLRQMQPGAGGSGKEPPPGQPGI